MESGQEASLAGFEPATHGPGNRLRSSAVSKKARFYAVSELPLADHIMTIDCHKLSDRLSAYPSPVPPAWTRSRPPYFGLVSVLTPVSSAASSADSRPTVSIDLAALARLRGRCHSL